MKKQIWFYWIKNEQDICLCCYEAKISINNFHCGFINLKTEHNLNKNLRPICQLCFSTLNGIKIINFMNNYGFEIRKDFYKSNIDLDKYINLDKNIEPNNINSNNIKEGINNYLRKIRNKIMIIYLKKEKGTLNLNI
jgi:hypothetical protein